MDPVTQEEFEVKRMAAEAQATASHKETVSKQIFDSSVQQLKCIVCCKSFQSPQALNNHLKSKKHSEREKQNSQVTMSALKLDVSLASCIGPINIYWT